MEKVEELAASIGACRICVERPRGKPLPHEPRPVAVLSSTAKIAICGQAPGKRVHGSGVPFLDPSGDRLRQWMGIGSDQFYDSKRIAIVPMGFCFPGYDAKGGDLPPRRECPPAWRTRVFAAMPQIELMVLVGAYAIQWHVPQHWQGNLTNTVAIWKEIVAQTASPKLLPLPHPSWRNSGWIRKNSWFAIDLLPFLQKQVQKYR